MSRSNLLIVMSIVLVLAALHWGDNLAYAGAGVGASTDLAGNPVQVPTYYANSPAGTWTDWAGNVHDSGTAIRKFVDSLPGVPNVTTYNSVANGYGTDGANALGQYIPLAVPESWAELNGTKSDYYEIGVVEYTEKMHSDLPKATTLRGYVQLVPCGGTAIPLTIANGLTTNVTGVTTTLCGADKPHYLGPLIVATRGKAVRIKYTNLLPTGRFSAGFRNGDLFIPVDETLQGAGIGPNNLVDKYTQNRTAIHLHGGDNPWISDGTPHQWLTPAGEATPYQTGASLANVPDMPNPGAGSGTLYYPNGDGARLMFYHEHALGITRLNVYAGVAAGYLLTEPAAEGLLPAIPGGQVPLVIQEKTFVPKDVNVASGTSLGQDAKWDTVHWGQYGDLWYPHVYETNQDPNSFDGANPVGRWDYGPWFWPVFPVTLPLPTGVYGDVTTTPEAFGDTPIVNGTLYPTLTVNPTAYRFRVLNAINDRTLNLSLYTADPNVITSDGRTNTEVRMVPFIGPNTVTSSYTCPPSGMTEVSTFYPISFPCAGGMLGTGWGQQDNRPGGIPDPATAGPHILQIGSEGGLLPQVVDIPSTPINYEYNKRSVTVLNVLEHGLYLMPAERADAVIDFSRFAGQTLVLYNDAPAPLPAGDPRIDYYTDNPDFTAVGGAPSTLAGYGPNTRTIMQIKVGVGTHANAGRISNIELLSGGIGYSPATKITITDGTTTDSGTPTLGGGGVITAITPANPATVYTAAPKVTIADATGTGAVALVYLTPAPAFDVAALNAALPQAYAVSQPRPIVAQAAYGPPFGTTFTDQYARIFAGSAAQPLVTWTDGNGVARTYSVSGFKADGVTPADGKIFNKAIQELFDDRGRMNATLGVELPFTNALTQTTIPLGYIDPATEIIQDGETQIWKITHNGVDTHPVHFHLVNVQVINRVGWDGTVKPPHPYEVGWKETVKMNPLEDIVVAVRAKAPKLPFGLPTSSRYLDPTQPPNVLTGFTQIDPSTGNPSVVKNVLADFGWEYVWHCHILGHEENDFMRPFIFRYPAVAPPAPTNLTLTAGIFSWTDPTPGAAPTTLGNPQNEIGFRIERVANNNGVPGSNWATVGTALANATTGTDTQPLAPNTDYSYHVIAYNAAGDSPPSNTVTLVQALSAPTNLVATANSATRVTLTWTDTSTNEAGFQVQRATIIGGVTGSFADLSPAPSTGPNITTYVDTTVSAVTTYAYRVVAVNSLGSSPPSNTVTLTTPAAITAPIGLTASMFATRIGLSWTDASNNETSFAVWRSVNGGGATQIGTVARSATQSTATGGTVTFSDLGISAGNTYSYYVTAVNATGSSLPSNTATVSYTVPLAPSGLTGTIARIGGAMAFLQDSVRLNWTDNSTNETGFQIQRATSATFAGATTFTVGANVTSFTQNVSRIGNPTYYYRVRATNVVGNSGWSNVVSFRAP